MSKRRIGLNDEIIEIEREHKESIAKDGSVVADRQLYRAFAEERERNEELRDEVRRVIEALRRI